MLVTTKSILNKAQKGNYAIGAFNTNNLEITQAIIAAAIETKSPVIIQTSEGAIEYAGLEYIYNIMKIASKAPVPVAIHLDHGKKLEIIKKCIDIGYTSVMIDGSSFEYKENIKTTKKVVAMAKKKNVSVEAELGAIAGIEDFVSVEAKDALLTNPQQAAEFVKKTNCDSLAIAIGTAHGIHKFTGEPHLDLNRLKEINKLVKIPLVLHGASEVDKRMLNLAIKFGAKIKKAKGVNDALMKKCVKYGVNKVNTDTDLRLAFDAGIREIIKTKPEVFDPRKILQPAKEYIKQIVKERIIVLGSKNKG
ncbi:class II fructose-1,6-bisphosphate aldolase [Patescibacteria group bacterium]